MKKIVFILMVIVSFSNCKNDTKKEPNLEENRAKSYDQNDGLVTLHGDFLYDEEKSAAILQTTNEVYGVVIDNNMHLLEKKVTPYKKEATDMVPATVRVRKFEKKEDEEGWQYRVEIKDILKVEAPNPNKKDVIKLGN